MSRRGVKTLFERMSDAVTQDESYAPPAPPPPPAPRQQGITDAEAKVKNKALTAFGYWLAQADKPLLDVADPATVAARYPPLAAADVAQMIKVRRKGLK